MLFIGPCPSCPRLPPSSGHLTYRLSIFFSALCGRKAHIVAGNTECHRSKTLVRHDSSQILSPGQLTLKLVLFLEHSLPVFYVTAAPAALWGPACLGVGMMGTSPVFFSPRASKQVGLEIPFEMLCLQETWFVSPIKEA